MEKSASFTTTNTLVQGELKKAEIVQYCWCQACMETSISAHTLYSMVTSTLKPLILYTSPSPTPQASSSTNASHTPTKLTQTGTFPSTTIKSAINPTPHTFSTSSSVSTNSTWQSYFTTAWVKSGLTGGPIAKSKIATLKTTKYSWRSVN